MARDMFKYVNTVGWKNDLESFRRLKKEVRGFKKEIDSLYKGVNKNLPKSPFSGGGGGGYSKSNRHLVDKEMDRRFNREMKREEDLHKLRKSKQEELQSQQNLGRRSAVSGLTSGGGGLRAKDSALADLLRKEESQSKFVEKQEDMIRNFFISNRQMRQLTDNERKQYEIKLKSLKTLKETRYVMRQIRTNLQDQLTDERKSTREKEKQNALTKRLNSSYLQLGTSIASAYTALAAGQQIVQTGIAIEGINKTLLSVTGSTSAAAEEFKFLEEESLRLGLSLQEGGKAYAKLLAAGKGKLELQEIRDTFTAVSEAGTVLGLSQDDMAGGIRA